MMKNRRIRFGIMMALALLLAACGMYQNYGRFVVSAETERAFRQSEVTSDFHYYISGPAFYPVALLGLHRDYRLSPGNTWREVKMTPEAMKETIENMKTRASQFQCNPSSYQLLDYQGRAVGVWYSIREAVTFLHTEGDGSLRIDTPPLDVFIKMDAKGP